MKKYILFVSIIFLIALPYGIAADKEISILKIKSASISFNEMRESGNNSIYNCFDNNLKTVTFFSDFSVQFNTPVTIDELRIVNGYTDNFKKFSRLKDIEIILYTIEIKKENKNSGTKVKKDVPESTTEKKSLPGKKEKNNKTEIKTLDDKTEKIIPDNDRKNENQNKKKSGDALTTKNKMMIKPVIGELNDVLAEEPIPHIESKADTEKKIIKKEKQDIRDQTIIPEKAGVSEKKKPEIKKIKNSNNKLTKTSIPKVKKTADKKNIEKRDSIKQEDDKMINDPVFKKMSGIYKVENDSLRRVLVYFSLKDISSEQSIKLGGTHAITAIEFRNRDDSYYNGELFSLPYITEIYFASKGKKIFFNGIESLKKNYKERYIEYLKNSISGGIFKVYEGEQEATRVYFREDGVIEYRDRHKCRNTGDPDCTSSSMPDKWMIKNDQIYMRFQKEWFPWKYELAPDPEIYNDKSDKKYNSQWFKIYYKNGNTFSETFLYLERDDNLTWRWN